jgi:hypothetical protein
MIVWVVFFSGCITRMVPDNLRRLLDHPIVKVGVLTLIVYLAEKDFKLAVVVTAGFFLSTAPLDIKEGMAVPDDCNPITDDSYISNPLQLVTSCGNTGCELVQEGISVPRCEPKCASGDNETECNTIGDKCDWDGTNCQKRCSTFDESACPSGRCAVYDINGDNKCEKPCGQFTKDTCPKDGLNAHCKLDSSDNCVNK